MLELNHVTKQFPPLVAVNDVSFNVPHGSVLGLLGPNGAGKTTLFKLMAGFLYPDAGQIQATHTWPMTGFKPERLLYPGHLQVGEYLELVAHLSNTEKGRVRQVVAEALTVRPHVTIRATQDLTQMRACLESLHPKIHAVGVEVTLSEEAIELRRDVLRIVLEAGLDVCHVEQQRATLQEIYAEVVQS